MKMKGPATLDHDARMGAPDQDKEIVDLLGVDRDRAMDLMIERYGPMLFRYAKRMCGGTGEAEDVLQDTFLAAQEKLGQFRGEGKIRNWLFSIAGNACRQRYRRLKTRGEVELTLDDVAPTPEGASAPEPPSWQLDPSERMLSDELTARLEAAIAEIPPTNRSVLILRDLEGLSTRETAEALQITEEAAKVRLHRARAFVRNRLKNYYQGKE